MTPTRHAKKIISSPATNFCFDLSLSPQSSSVTLTSHFIWIPLKSKVAVTGVGPFAINTGFIVAAGVFSCTTLVYIFGEIKNILLATIWLAWRQLVSHVPSNENFWPALSREASVEVREKDAESFTKSGNVGVMTFNRLFWKPFLSHGALIRHVFFVAIFR